MWDEDSYSLNSISADSWLFDTVVPDLDVYPGSGHPTGIWWGERKLKRGKRLDDILKQAMEQIIRGDVEIEPETVVAKAVEIVKPYIETKQQDSKEPVSSIDWKAVEADVKKVKELLRLWQEQVEAIEEEDLILLAAYEYYY
jgi:hypothetical protein